MIWLTAQYRASPDGNDLAIHRIMTGKIYFIIFMLPAIWLLASVPPDKACVMENEINVATPAMIGRIHLSG